jgi:hypothetical protein
MNIKHLFFCMLLMTFSSCSKPGYEKAIAEWVQTDSQGTWTDLKFELLEGYNRIGQPASFKQQKRTTSRYHRKGGKSSYLVKPSFPAYMEAEKNIKETEAMKAMYQNRDSAEVIGKILKCRYSIVQPHSGVQQKKTGSFLLSPNMEKCIGKLKPVSK